jgi:hemolysin III
VNAQQGLGDILVNTITHGMGAVLAIAGAVVLVVSSAGGSTRLIVGCAVFGTTLILVYLCSTLYHSLIRTRARRCFKIFDHSAIYLLIAGTYTPFTLGPLSGRTGWILFAAVWTLAIAGVLFKSFAVERFHVLSAIVYIAMGWLIVFATGPLIRAVTWHGAAWLLAGGICYTGGVLFFALDRTPYFHGIWHLCVLGGSTFHYFAVWFYVLPHPR